MADDLLRFKSKAHRTENPLIKYASDNSLRLTPVQEKLIEATQQLNNGFMLSSADELHLLGNICRAIKAKKTLDIGVYTGYSALTIAMAIPEDGKVVALEENETYINIARPFWEQAHVSNKIDVTLGPAVKALEKLVDNGESGTFDFAFIDADKPNYDNYYELCLKLVRPGGIIAVDNVLWDGKVVDPEANDSLTSAIKKINAKIGKDERVEVSLLAIGDGTSLVFKK